LIVITDVYHQAGLLVAYT